MNDYLKMAMIGIAVIVFTIVLYKGDKLISHVVKTEEVYVSLKGYNHLGNLDRTLLFLEDNGVPLTMRLPNWGTKPSCLNLDGSDVFIKVYRETYDNKEVKYIPIISFLEAYCTDGELLIRKPK